MEVYSQTSSSLEQQLDQIGSVCEHLQASEERYRLALHGSQDGLWDWNLETNEVYLSPQWKAMLGYAESEIGTNPADWLNRIHRDDYQSFRDRLDAHCMRMLPHFEHEQRVLHNNGSYRWMLCRGMAVWDASGRAVRVVGLQTDITNRKQAEEELRYMALHDTLTGLPNRLLFTDRLNLAVERTRRGEEFAFAVILLDVDDFKQVNDTLGHLAGDHLLVAIAQRLSACLRGSDTVVRLGGDEFAVILESIGDVYDVVDVVNRMRRVIGMPFMLDGSEVFASVSIGVVLSTPQYTESVDLLRDADTALYQAKELGRGQYAVFDLHMHAQEVERLTLEYDLRQALQRHELRVFYQPVVDLFTRRIIGFEALVRWQHPQRGLLSPADFLPIAESLGLETVIDRWVLDKACKQIQEWQRILAGLPLTMTVNLSGQNLLQSDLVEHVASLLRETGIHPRSLKLEFTERSLIKHFDAAVMTLVQLRELNVQIGLDNFGTGWSSLGCLQRFPLDALKFDHSFVDRIVADTASAEIMRTIVTLARTLGLDVTAQGVETEEHLVYLLALNCAYVQGFVFAGPLDSSNAQTLLISGPPWS